MSLGNCVVSDPDDLKDWLEKYLWSTRAHDRGSVYVCVQSFPAIAAAVRSGDGAMAIMPLLARYRRQVGSLDSVFESMLLLSDTSSAELTEFTVDPYSALPNRASAFDALMADVARLAYEVGDACGMGVLREP